MRRYGRLATLAVSAIAGTGTLFPVAAHAAGNTIHVDNSNPNCVSAAGAGAGSESTPYCGIDAAGSAAQPGDTVLVAPSATPYDSVSWTEIGTPPSTVNGTPGNPITFKA